jgi:3-mercaptopyruvate sulfurtransferase SseA
MHYRMEMKLAATAVVAAFMLGGCGGGGGGSSSSGTVNGVNFAVNSPAQIAQASADDYNNNVYGLITAATLKRWKDNWTANRPSGITGKLVILQVTKGPTVNGVDASFIAPNGAAANNAMVVTYQTNSGEWSDTRDNGVTRTVTMVAPGEKMDASFNKYNIDPTKDMIVIAQGSGSYGNPMSTGRIWFAMRYWGIDHTHLAQLNGANYWETSPGVSGNGLSAADFKAEASTVPTTPGSFTVKNIKVDNTKLLATMEDMIANTPSTDEDRKNDGVFIWDARNVAQYSAGEIAERGDSASKTNCTPMASPTVNPPTGPAYCQPNSVNDYSWTFQNAGARQGHPNGTLQLQYTNMLDPYSGYSFKPKATLKAYMDGMTDQYGYGFVGSKTQSNYGLVGPGNAYQPGDTVYVYCETTVRAQVTGFVSAAILGLPTRYYDGAMTEWNSLSTATDASGNLLTRANGSPLLLPFDSPWRSETKSFFRWAKDATPPSTVGEREITNAYGRPNLIEATDKAYKTGESVSSGGGTGGGGGGGGLPANPCGG